VLLIDKADKNIGGDCLNFGCIPSKALIHVARTISKAKEANNFGVATSGKPDIKKIKEYIKSKQDTIRKHENAEYLKSLGMTVVLGEAKFISKDKVEVNGTKYRGKKIILAAGLKPRKLDTEGVDKVKVYNNENIFDIDFMPERLLVIGGGPIGIEIGQAFNHLGSKVTVLQGAPSILGKEDPEVTGILLQHLKDEGIEFYFNCNKKRFISSNKIHIESDGNSKEIEFDAVFAAVGRELNVEKLDLEKADIKLDENGRKIKSDNYLRTTNKKVYLCGDILGQHQFTHAAELHAGAILRNFFSPFKKELNTDHISWVTYTYPEIATFGLSEGELKKRNINYQLLESSFEDDDRAIVSGFTKGKVKLFIFKNKLLGGTMIAPDAGELFQKLVLANSSNLDIKHLFNKIYPYPTASRINKKVISSYFVEKLNSFNKKILHILFH